MYISREQIREYREIYKPKQKDAQLVIDTKVATKMYLELMKELLIKTDLVTKMMSEELSELCFSLRKAVKKLVLRFKKA